MTLQAAPAPARPTSRQWAALAVLVLPVLLISIDMTVLSFALPAISEAVSPTGTQLLWIVDGYSLAIAGLLVTMGTLGDRYGARRMLLIGSAGFGVVSFLAAFADSATALIAARVALGVFGATLMPSTLSLLRSTFTDREQRRTAFAVWAGGFAAGGALGPIVGGWLLEHFRWGSVFLLNVPFMVALLVLAPLLVREHRNPGAHGRLDLVSVAVSVLALTSLVYGVKTLAEHGFTTGPVATSALGLVLAVVFVRRQLRLADPLLDVDLFRLPVFRASVLANLMSVCGMTGMLFAVSQYLQLVLGMRPLHAGLLLLPGAVVTFAAGLVAARLARRLRLDLLIATGLLLGTTGYVVMSLLGSGTGTGAAVQLAVAFVVLCAGAGLAETLTNDAILSAAPAHRTGAASAISETAYEVGAVLGTTVLGSVLNAVYRHRVEVPAGAEQARETLGAAVETAAALPDGSALLDSARAAFTHGLDATALAGAVLTAGAALVVWRSLRPRGVEGAGRA
ncbi:DHA2 family multidrug resistance protein-like MFS transporter [Kineococcus rhizosphaerae]|uniref:DHA2 family multidrug resistance protein-like MFS transporter n=2 Tax=Kineococcus rhizosphaerae TaxID=559628 RepID=A0A2T0QYK1_9ACTN|nr:DHA2 family multidrug resistance protein-like MFS transporter [Kineococcus rhizosphaerae]